MVVHRAASRRATGLLSRWRARWADPSKCKASFRVQARRLNIGKIFCRASPGSSSPLPARVSASRCLTRRAPSSVVVVACTNAQRLVGARAGGGRRQTLTAGVDCRTVRTQEAPYQSAFRNYVTMRSAPTCSRASRKVTSGERSHSSYAAIGRSPARSSSR